MLDPPRKLKEGERCGMYFGMCEVALHCQKNEDVPDYPGVCVKSKLDIWICITVDREWIVFKELSRIIISF